MPFSDSYAYPRRGGPRYYTQPTRLRRYPMPGLQARRPVTRQSQLSRDRVQSRAQLQQARSGYLDEGIRRPPAQPAVPTRPAPAWASYNGGAKTAPPRPTPTYTQGASRWVK